MALTHGGQLSFIAKQFGLDENNWLDLSTGISPYLYPIPKIPKKVYAELPTTSNALLEAAKQYYQCQNLLPISGSQAIIQLLPTVHAEQLSSNKASTRVYLPKVGYKEHQKAWQQANYQTHLYDELPEPDQLVDNAIVVVINPNNPTAKLYSANKLLSLLDKLEQLNGWLIVDEAFFDLYPQKNSMMLHTHRAGLIVLRSIGKFFGLAGLRIGFVSAQQKLLNSINEMLGPWTVNGPAQYITQQALGDVSWQQSQQLKLTKQSQKLTSLLRQYFDNTALSTTSLFVTVHSPQAKSIFAQLAQQKVYVRLCDEKNALRFGIPRTSDLVKLELALQSLAL